MHNTIKIKIQYTPTPHQKLENIIRQINPFKYTHKCLLCPTPWLTHQELQQHIKTHHTQ